MHPKITTNTSNIEFHGRKFDGLSFFGGILLASFVVFAALFVFKRYRIIAFGNDFRSNSYNMFSDTS